MILRGKDLRETSQRTQDVFSYRPSVWDRKLTLVMGRAERQLGERRTSTPIADFSGTVTRFSRDRVTVATAFITSGSR